jgi:hypothetical protein
MESIVRLVGTGNDGQSRDFDVMSISRPQRLGDIANLGLTLAEGSGSVGARANECSLDRGKR